MKKSFLAFCQYLLLLCFAFPCSPYSLSRIDALASSSKNTSNKLLNLVFVETIPFSQQSDTEDIAFLIEKLTTTAPFDEFVEAIAVWQVRLSDTEMTDFFKSNKDYPYLSVRQGFLDSLAQAVGQPFKLVIIEKRGSVACAEISSIGQTSLIILSKSQYSGEVFWKSFLHELGHALGLRDEGEASSPCVPGPPNCAATKEEALMWWGALVGKSDSVNYFAGCCGNAAYIRPTARSIMNDMQKSESFGPVNEEYLRSILKNYSEQYAQ